MRIFLLHFYSVRPSPAYPQIAAALRDRGHTVWLGAPNEQGNLAWHDGDHVVRVLAGPRRMDGRISEVPLLAAIPRRIAYLGFLLRLRRFLRQQRPDIVQVNRASIYLFWLIPMLMPRRMAFALDFRQVGQRTANDVIGRLRGWLAIWGSRFCSRFIYQRACFLHAAGARRILGKNWKQYGSVVTLGVAEAFVKTTRPHQPALGDDESVRFLYLGGLSRVRHLDQILLAVLKILPTTRDLAVDFMGIDKANGYYQELITELELDSVVTIRPAVSYQEIPEVISAYDVALAYVPQHPTHWQYQPTLKALEYRASGTPILATDNVPNREIVEHEVNGLIVGNSVDSIARGMLRFVTDRTFLESCRQKAMEMRRGTTWAEVAEQYERNVYLPLSGRSPLKSPDLFSNL